MGLVTGIAVHEGVRTDREVATANRARALGEASHATEALGEALAGRVSDLAGLFNSSNAVDAAEFSAFTEPMLVDSGAASLSWVELIPDSRRATVERTLGTPVAHLDASGASVPAPRQPSYAVTTFTKTVDDSQALIGVDVEADPLQAAAIRGADRSSAPRSTGLSMLRGDADPGFMIFVPAYGPNAGPTAQRRPIGFVSGGFRLSELEALLGPTVRPGTQVQIRLAGTPVVSIGRLHGTVSRNQIQIAGQRWQILVSGGHPEAQVFGLSRALAAGIFLGLLTLLITGLTHQAVAAAGRSEELARLRQQERDQAINEREYSEMAAQELLAHLPDLAVLRFDADLRVLSANGGLLERAGWTRAEMEGRLVGDLFGGPDGSRLVDPMRRALRGESDAFAFGGIRDASMRYWMQSLPLPGDEPAGLLVATNVSDLLDAQLARDTAEQRFERAFDGAPIGMALVRPDGGFDQVNDALCAIIGHTAADLATMNAADITCPHYLVAARGHLAALVERRTDSASFEQRWIHADGQLIPVALHATGLTDVDDRIELILLQVLDVTERRLHEDQLQHLADHDPLTGLRNRRSFEQALETQLACVERYGPEGALIMLDLDHFKAVNDTFGHLAGDEVLESVAMALRRTLRASDTIGRLGGDEFAVLLPKADLCEARIVAAKLSECVRAEGLRLQAGGPGHPVTASVGVVVLAAEHRTVAEASAAADAAMYAAKTAGRDHYAIAPPPGPAAAGSGASTGS